ncbi:MAG: hypothetical protein D6828_04340, partial [Nitrospirae bacterium]
SLYRMKPLLIISGRYLKENPYRELRLKESFEKHGYEVVLALPSRAINANGYPNEVKDDAVFRRAGAVWLSSEDDYKRYMAKSYCVIFGSWKSYEPLTEMAHMLGKPVLNFNTTSGLDYWPHGVNRGCVKGPFSKRHLLYLQEVLPNYGSLDEKDIIITGSIIHEHYESAKPVDMSYEEFIRYYGLDPIKPVVVFFPKGIGSFRRFIDAWFPAWSEEKRDAYNQWFLDKYAEICFYVKEANCNLIVKMHPTAYTSYLTRSDEEYAYWSRFPWVKVLKPEHTYACYKHATCGIGVNTHSSLDMGYYNKPFIYVDSDLIEQPKHPVFHVNHLCSLPKGPSSHWHEEPSESVNPRFPSWLGYFCRAKELPTLLNGEVQKPIPHKYWRMFVEEFWYRDDGRSCERIVDVVSNYIENWNSIKGLYTSLSAHSKFKYRRLNNIA